ncbi:MAG: hypothetical protein O2807_12475 [bacterium]|nr:hypothetical protein [bacterium]
MRKKHSAFFLLLAFAAATGCGTRPGQGPEAILRSFAPPSGVQAEASPALTSRTIRRIAILPFRNESGVEGAGQTVATIFYEGISASPRYEVEPPPRLDRQDGFNFEFRLRGGREADVRNEEADAEWLSNTVNHFVSRIEPYLTNLQPVYPGEYIEGKIGPKKKLQGTVARSSDQPDTERALDAVITGVVTRFRNRSGNALFANDEKGAHVTYSVYLVDARDGKVLWKASFNEKQIFLLDNLLLLPRYAQQGFIWQTNTRLARTGLQRLLATFPGWNPNLVIPGTQGEAPSAPTP